MTNELVDLCSVNDVSLDTPASATIGGEQVAVFEVDGAYYVTQDQCTHGPGLLSEGWVEGREVECPFHQGKFDIVTGKPTAAPCTIALKTWPVEVRGDRICAMRRAN